MIRQHPTTNLLHNPLHTAIAPTKIHDCHDQHDKSNGPSEQIRMSNDRVPRCTLTAALGRRAILGVDLRIADWIDLHNTIASAQSENFT